MKKAASGILPLIALDRSATCPLHKQIYDCFRSGIVDGSLRGGQRLPSSRVLATELGVSRFPVLTAYSQLLAEGFFESRIGSGTLVSTSLPDGHARNSQRQPAAEPVPRDQAKPTQQSLKPVWLQGSGGFLVGEVACKEFPQKIWSRLVSRHSRNDDGDALRYGDPMGLPTLREAISEYLRAARSVRCDPDQIMIVSGSQQALDLCARVLVGPGDSVWVEEPGYRPAREIFSQTGCRLVPVPVDGAGLDVAAGIEKYLKARVAVVTPSHQLPLGVTMTASRRLQLLEWARNVGAWIIEDDYDSEYRYDRSPIAALQGLDKTARVVYVGTFSKVLFPSLRLGYLVIPKNLVERFAVTRTMMDSCPPTFFQGVVADFIREGHFARHLRRMRTLYNRRRTVLVECLTKEFGDMIEIGGNEAGLYLTAVFKNGTGLRDTEVSERAAQHNLRVWPLSRCYVGKSHRNGMLLGYGNTSETQIPRCVRKLREVYTAR